MTATRPLQSSREAEATTVQVRARSSARCHASTVCFGGRPIHPRLERRRRGGRGQRRRSRTPTRRRRGRRGPPRREPSPPARGDLDRRADEVGLELHQEAVGARAAVGAQDTDLERQNIEDVGHLVRDRLERGAHEMRAGRAPGEAADQSAGVRIPLRRAQTRQRRDEEDAFRRGDLAASASDSAAVSITPSPSRSHSSAAPPTSTAPSAAN